MERLTRPCKDTENGKYIPYTAGTYIGIYPDCTLGQVVEKLAHYEDLEEKGRLFIVDIRDVHPCENCDVGWGSIGTEGSDGCENYCERLKQYNVKISLENKLQDVTTL